MSTPEQQQQNFMAKHQSFVDSFLKQQAEVHAAHMAAIAAQMGENRKYQQPQNNIPVRTVYVQQVQPSQGQFVSYSGQQRQYQNAASPQQVYLQPQQQPYRNPNVQQGPNIIRQPTQFNASRQEQIQVMRQPQTGNKVPIYVQQVQQVQRQPSQEQLQQQQMKHLQSQIQQNVLQQQVAQHQMMQQQTQQKFPQQYQQPIQGQYAQQAQQYQQQHQQYLNQFQKMSDKPPPYQDARAILANVIQRPEQSQSQPQYQGYQQNYYQK
ncbi:hypothetical protein HDV01_007071 [Terramyces sp. JEL0728]|nr:hypothetical protein HDV01_007071 [Terramyces sp. JEL0728]